MTRSGCLKTNNEKQPQEEITNVKVSHDGHSCLIFYWAMFVFLVLINAFLFFLENKFWCIHKRNTTDSITAIFNRNESYKQVL